MCVINYMKLLQREDIKIDFRESYPSIYTAINDGFAQFASVHGIKEMFTVPEKFIPDLDDRTLYRYNRAYKNSYSFATIDPRFDEIMYGYFNWVYQGKAIDEMV